MNRHPAVLARMVATLWDQSGGRVELGIGVGGSGPELPSYGIELPEPQVRSAMLEEAVAVIRLLWTGGPVDYDGRYFKLHEAYAHPAPEPPPRIIVGGEKPAGARLAALAGDGWTTNAADYEALLPVHLEELAAQGRSRAQIAHLIAVSIDKDVPLDRQPLIADMATFLGEWQRRGADEIIVSWVKPADLPALLEAGARASLASKRSGRAQIERGRARLTTACSGAQPVTVPSIAVDPTQPHDVCLKCGRPTPLGVSLCENRQPGPHQGAIDDPGPRHDPDRRHRRYRAGVTPVPLRIGRYRPVPLVARRLLDARRRRPRRGRDSFERRSATSRCKLPDIGQRRARLPRLRLLHDAHPARARRRRSHRQCRPSRTRAR